MSVSANVRNVIIVLALAAVVAVVPGGGTVAQVILQAASLAFLAALAWIAGIQYREHRTALYSLGDGRRAALYAAVATLAITLTATARLWHTSTGSVAWLVLVGAALYVGVSIILAARRY